MEPVESNGQGSEAGLDLTIPWEALPDPGALLLSGSERGPSLTRELLSYDPGRPEQLNMRTRLSMDDIREIVFLQAQEQLMHQGRVDLERLLAEDKSLRVSLDGLGRWEAVMMVVRVLGGYSGFAPLPWWKRNNWLRRHPLRDEGEEKR